MMHNSSRFLRMLMLGTVTVLGVGVGQIASSGQVLADDDDRENRGRGSPNDGLKVYLDRTLHPTAQDCGTTSGRIWQGAGSTPFTFQRKRNVDAGIELGLKAVIPFTGPDIRSSYVDGGGLVHIEVPAGPSPLNAGRAAFNFTWSYDVALDPSNPPLDQYNVELWFDVDPSEKTKYVKARLVRIAPAVAPVCPGEPDSNGYAFKVGNSFITVDEEGTSQVTQNSQNFGFSAFRSRIDGDPDMPGTQPYNFTPGQFDIVLLISKKGKHHDDDDNEDDDDDGDRHGGRDSAILHVVIDVGIDASETP